MERRADAGTPLHSATIAGLTVQPNSNLEPDMMRHTRTLLALFVLASTVWVGSLNGQQRPAQNSGGDSFSNRLYWGGGISLAFWNYTRIRVEPLVGYRITPELSAGLKLAYEYLRYDQFGRTVTSHNYGGSLFARYRFIPQLYAHAEYGRANYESVDALGNESRQGYPFLLLGGGFVQRTGRRTSLFFELLYDVLQDEASPYDTGGPFLTIGITVGF